MALLVVGCMEPDTSDLQQFVAETKAKSPGKKLDPPPEIEPYRPFTYTAQGLKDPFLPSAFVQQVLSDLAEIPPEEQEEIPDNGIRPDLNRPREELEKYALGSLRMVGTFLQSGQLWALIQAPDGIVHRVQIGNYLGLNHGKITSITDQRIELTEIVAEGKRWVERDAFLSLTER
ncbi:MAG: pilus assembly protein PilP [Gammaproteobacteria bacterium]|nr:pilus assembly protein PilP [Gammaproteobacteria bacterium]MCP5424662.1 pilus assembly protein PilP [Gammaproteobacteria bacterium]